MLTREASYTDYNGVNRKEILYFNLEPAELMEMELGTTGGLTQMINRVIAAQDNATLVRIFKELILKAYGEKSDDGKRLVKSEAISTAFSQTRAYSDLFMELVTDAEKAAACVNGIVPEEIAEKAKEQQEQTVPMLPS